jgi:hypothetical protein
MPSNNRYQRYQAVSISTGIPNTGISVSLSIEIPIPLRYPGGWNYPSRRKLLHKRGRTKTASLSSVRSGIRTRAGLVTRAGAL